MGQHVHIVIADELLARIDAAVEETETPRARWIARACEQRLTNDAAGLALLEDAERSLVDIALPVRPSPMVGETTEPQPAGLVRGCCPECGATSGDEACWDPEDGYRDGCPIASRENPTMPDSDSWTCIQRLASDMPRLGARSSAQSKAGVRPIPKGKP